jgi:hypothetical protein
VAGKIVLEVDIPSILWHFLKKKTTIQKPRGLDM